MGLLSLEKRRLQEDTVAAFQYLRGAYKKEGDQLFTRPDHDRTRRNGFKLREGKIKLMLEGNFLLRAW